MPEAWRQGTPKGVFIRSAPFVTVVQLVHMFEVGSINDGQFPERNAGADRAKAAKRATS